MKQYKVYADTSVFGGCFDTEFKEDSIVFFQKVRAGEFSLIISTTLLAELNEAPEYVQEVLSSIPEESVKLVEFTKEIKELRDSYIKNKVLGNKSIADAEHVATATVANADFIISWNFKHIVHFEKISGFNSVNLNRGYKMINIFSPRQVV